MCIIGMKKSNAFELNDNIRPMLYVGQCGPVIYQHFFGDLESILPHLFGDSYKIQYIMHNVRSAAYTC